MASFSKVRSWPVINKFRIKSWPKISSLLLALIPLSALLIILIIMTVQSYPAIQYIGLGELFSSKFSSVYSGSVTGDSGLLPAIWGTVMIVAIAMAIALPVSLAIAIFSELSGRLGGIMRSILGVLSGIPSVVYALGAAVFIMVLMVPDFCGGFSTTSDGGDPSLKLTPDKLGITVSADIEPEAQWQDENWLTSGIPVNGQGRPILPWGGLPNSTLLAGMVLALLIIPFLAPLIDDAVRNVPHGLKEASLSLGAGRWYTLRRIVLPGASPGIVYASALGTLKALGDIMIAVFVIGYVADNLPVPLFDALEKTSPLASLGAGLFGGLSHPRRGTRAPGKPKALTDCFCL
jgi:phosphate transport system permease protein